MKAILVIDDMPEKCKNCRFKQASLTPTDELKWLCLITDEHIILDEKSEYCPIKPIPSKRPVSYDDEIFGTVTNISNIAWNECIEEIEK